MTMAAKFLHNGMLRNQKCLRAIEKSGSVRLHAPTTAQFLDYHDCILTFGFDRHVPEKSSLEPTIRQLWYENATENASLALASVDGWLQRQFQYAPFRRPWGSKVFERIREAALFSGNLVLVAQPHALAKEVRDLLVMRPQAVASAAVRRSAVLKGCRADVR